MVEGQVLTPAQELRAAAELASRESFKIEVVRDFDQFNAISREWDQLVDACGTDRVFLSHTWFRTWWEAFGAGKQLHIVTVRCGESLVAIAPMMRARASIYGFHVDALHAIYNVHSPRYDFIVAADRRLELYEAIWKQLADQNDCDMIVIAQVPDDSWTIGSIASLAQAQGWLAGQWVAPSSPFISLGCDYEDYANNLKPGCRARLAKRYAKLRSIVPVDVEFVTAADAVESAMRDGFRIENAGWKGRKGTAMLSDPAVAEFYLRLAQREAALGQLRLTFLRAAGERIAFNYLLQKKRKLYAVKIGYDPHYQAFSPGNMLLNLILKDACSRGIEEYDLLGGDDRWKFEWTDNRREHRWLFVSRNHWRLRALHHLKFSAVPVVKKYAGRT